MFLRLAALGHFWWLSKSLPSRPWAMEPGTLLGWQGRGCAKNGELIIMEVDSHQVIGCRIPYEHAKSAYPYLYQAPTTHWVWAKLSPFPPPVYLIPQGSSYVLDSPVGGTRDHSFQSLKDHFKMQQSPWEKLGLELVPGASRVPFIFPLQRP